MQLINDRAGSFMRLVRLKTQGPARTARYKENLQSRIRTTFGPEISREKNMRSSKNVRSFNILGT